MSMNVGIEDSRIMGIMSDYVGLWGLCWIMSDYVGLCRVFGLDFMSGFSDYVGLVGLYRILGDSRIS
jgi:hypothetical protein